MAEFDRRRLVHVAATLAVTGGIVAVPPGRMSAAAAQGAQKRGQDQDADDDQDKMPEVTPPEDLMREHGVLNRVLLIYEASLRNFAANQSFDPSVIVKSADIVRTFIEGYHERNEENQVFPRFRKAGQLVDLVNTLYQQHQAGRRLTDTILKLAPNSGAAGDDRQRLIGAMQAFITMYRPHESREDTVLFPALRKVVSPHEFDAMAEDFEKDEQQKFGQDGFETMVNRVAGIERELGIYDLSKFTPT